MSIHELQEKLVDKIRSTNEDYVLEEVYRLLQLEANNQQVYQLNDEQAELIDTSLNEIEQGKYYSNEEVKKETEEWLNK
jgi:PBP1b-binding outer membrane lipoprotein LpoB